ncbi:hypothetical protein CBL_03321 [Carabus blaptoides fortunei]
MDALGDDVHEKEGLQWREPEILALGSSATHLNHPSILRFSHHHYTTTTNIQNHKYGYKLTNVWTRCSTNPSIFHVLVAGSAGAPTFFAYNSQTTDVLVMFFFGDDDLTSAN